MLSTHSNYLIILRIQKSGERSTKRIIHVVTLAHPADYFDLFRLVYFSRSFSLSVTLSLHFPLHPCSLAFFLVCLGLAPKSQSAALDIESGMQCMSKVYYMITIRSHIFETCHYVPNMVTLLKRCHLYLIS